MSREQDTIVVDSVDTLFRATTRRNFLRAMGVGGTIMLMPSLFAACNGESTTITSPTGTTYTLDLSNDTGF